MTTKSCIRILLIALATICLSTRAHGQNVAGLFYHQDFEGPIGNEWSARSKTMYAYGSFLGEFSGEDSATLTITNIPPHTNIVISFDLLILKRWLGNNTDHGLAFWELRIPGAASPIIRTTFANDTDYKQSYPGNYLTRNDARTGTIENNTLGFRRAGNDNTLRDAIYRPVFRIPHTNGSIQLQFSGSGLEDVTQQSWGLDNVFVGTQRAPVVTLAATTTGGFTNGPVNAILSASLSDLDDQAQGIEFFRDDAKIGEVAAAPFNLAVSNLPAGHHRFMAKAKCADGSQFSSQEIVVPIQPSLIAPLAQWHYLDGGLLPGPTWTQLDFDDSSWAIGSGKFGYGQGDEDTVLKLGPNTTNTAITAYFRTTFVLASTNEFTNHLMLNAVYDGGVRAYLNGELATYTALPAIVDPTTLGTFETTNGTTSFMSLLPPDLLVVGTNVLAVELHLTATNDVDAALLMALSPAPIVFNTHPQDQNVVQGGLAEFSAAGPWTNSSAQWQHDGVDLPGKTNGSELILTNVQPAQMGTYRLKIQSSNLVIYSKSAILIVETNRAVLVESTFQNGREGWTTWDATPASVAPITFFPEGGVPGGYISADEVSNGDGATTFWVAPPKFLSDRRDAFGGSLEFTAKQNARDQQYGDDNSQTVVLIGGGLTIAHNSPYRPCNVWTHFDVPLLPRYWNIGGRPPTLEEMLHLLESLSTVQIRAEYRNLNDIDSLDSVRLLTGSSDGMAPLFIRQGTNGTIVVHWPASRTGLKLQSSDAPTGGIWNDVTMPLAEMVTNGLHSVWLSASGQPAFFRLVKRN